MQLVHVCNVCVQALHLFKGEQSIGHFDRRSLIEGALCQLVNLFTLEVKLKPTCASPIMIFYRITLDEMPYRVGLGK